MRTPLPSGSALRGGEEIRVRVHPADRAGCGYIRLRWVAEALKAQGADVSIGESIPAMWERGGGGLPPRVIGAAPFDGDVAVFQRVFGPDLLPVIRGLKQQGVDDFVILERAEEVIDIDDDFMALGPQHPAFRIIHPTTTPTGRSWAVLREAIQLADVVTVSTPLLARKYNGNVVRNCVPRAYLSIEGAETSHPKPVIGWPGTPITHPGDLEVIGDAVARVCASGQARFRAIGDPETLGILGVPDQQHQNGVPLETFDYARAVADLDVGIVPLVDTQFNAAKSWLKMAEFSSLGVPCVVSPTEENLLLHGHGIGLVARRPREWQRHLHTLADSADLRAEMGGRAREVMADLTIEDTMAPAVWDAWTLAAERSPHRARQMASSV